MKKMILAVALTGTLAGCTSSPQEKFIKQQEAIEAKKTSQVKETISNVPDWYIDYAQEDENYIYAVGTSVSTDPQTSLDDAKTLALSDATRKIKSNMTTQKSMLVKKDASGEVSNTSKQVIDEYTGLQDVGGNKLIQKKLIQEGSKFRAYVMVAVRKRQASTTDFIELDKSHSELLKRVTP